MCGYTRMQTPIIIIIDLSIIGINTALAKRQEPEPTIYMYMYISNLILLATCTSQENEKENMASGFVTWNYPPLLLLYCDYGFFCTKGNCQLLCYIFF